MRNVFPKGFLNLGKSILEPPVKYYGFKNLCHEFKNFLKIPWVSQPL